MIPQKYLGLIEMAFTFVVVAGFTIQQLWSLRDTGAKKPGETGDGKDHDDTPPPN
jgi:hypothetical protein